MYHKYITNVYITNVYICVHINAYRYLCIYLLGITNVLIFYEKKMTFKNVNQSFLFNWNEYSRQKERITNNLENYKVLLLTDRHCWYNSV